MRLMRSAMLRAAWEKEVLPSWRFGLPAARLEADDVLAALNGTSFLWFDNGWLPGLEVEDSEFLKTERIEPSECSKEHTASLRRYVDLWIATGRKKEGIETPSDRKPNRGIRCIVEEFHITHHMRPVPLRNG